MKQRGRKSAAALSVVPIGIDTHRPDPPGYLTAPQAKLWQAIVGDLPGGWITPAQEPLLAAYCRHVDMADWVSAKVAAFDFKGGDMKQLDQLLRMRDRETRASMALATKMRLTQQTRMHPRSAGRATENRSGRKLWERGKPWE